MSETASSSTTTAASKTTQPYGQWSTKREHVLIEAMHKYHPFSLKRLEIRKAWENIRDAVNQTDPDMNKLGMTTIKSKVQKIIQYYTDKQAHDIYYGRTSTEESEHERLVLDLITLMDKHDAIKNGKESESKTTASVPPALLPVQSEQPQQPQKQLQKSQKSQQQEEEEREEIIENNPINVPNPDDYYTALSEDQIISSSDSNEKDPETKSFKKRNRDLYARDMIDVVLKTSEEYREFQNSGLKSLEDIIRRFDASSRVIMEETKSLTISIRDDTAVMDQLLRQQVHHQNLINQQMMQMMQNVNFTLARFNNQVPIEPQHRFNPQQGPVAVGPPPLQYNHQPPFGLPPPQQQQHSNNPVGPPPPQQQHPNNQVPVSLPPRHQVQVGPPPQQPTNQAPTTVVPAQPQQPNKPVPAVIPSTQSSTGLSPSPTEQQQQPQKADKQPLSKRSKKNLV